MGEEQTVPPTVIGPKTAELFPKLVPLMKINPPLVVILLDIAETVGARVE